MDTVLNKITIRGIVQGVGFRPFVFNLAERFDLHGVEGVVIRRNKVCRVYVSATFVGQSAVVEVDAANVEVLD